METEDRPRSRHHLRFLEARRRIQQRGREFVKIGALILAAFAFWLWWRVPLLVNPWMVLEGVETEKLSEPTLRMMAAMLPIFVLATVGLAALLLGVVMALLRLEGRYLSLVDGHDAEGGPGR